MVVLSGGAVSVDLEVRVGGISSLIRLVSPRRRVESKRNGRVNDLV